MGWKMHFNAGLPCMGSPLLSGRGKTSGYASHFERVWLPWVFATLGLLDPWTWKRDVAAWLEDRS